MCIEDYWQYPHSVAIFIETKMWIEQDQYSYVEYPKIKLLEAEKWINPHASQYSR